MSRNGLRTATVTAIVIVVCGTITWQAWPAQLHRNATPHKSRETMAHPTAPVSSPPATRDAHLTNEAAVLGQPRAKKDAVAMPSARQDRGSRRQPSPGSRHKTPRVTSSNVTLSRRPPLHASRDACLQVLAEQPGWVSQDRGSGWTFACVKTMSNVGTDAAGSNLVMTGVTDYATRVVRILDGESIYNTRQIVVYEAAHAYGADHLTDTAKAWLDKQIGAPAWNSGSYRWTSLGDERWASTAATCQGYPGASIPPTFSCDLMREALNMSSPQALQQELAAWLKVVRRLQTEGCTVVFAEKNGQRNTWVACPLSLGTPPAPPDDLIQAHLVK